MSSSPATTSPSAKRPRRWVGTVICVGLVLAAAAAVGVVAQLKPRVEPAPPAQALPVNVKTWQVHTLPELADAFDLTAVVEPEYVVRVAAEVPGRIEQVGRRSEALTWRGRVFPPGSALKEGEPITAGEPIVYLNKDLLQARYARAQSQFEYDEREYRRLLDLYERGTGTTSKTELDDARTKRDIGKALLDEAARELERTTIVAPLSGILNRLPMEIGEYAAPGDQVAEIVDVSQVKVVVDIPERDVYYLAVGQVAEIFPLAPGSEPLTGEITYISELAEELARTTRTEITLENRDHLLRSGQIVKVRLTRRVLQDVIMIPLDCVIPLEVGRVVYVVDAEDQAQRRVVTLGFIKGRKVQVLNGLVEGDRLICVGHRYVGPGQPVIVLEEYAN